MQPQEKENLVKCSKPFGLLAKVLLDFGKIFFTTNLTNQANLA